MTNGKENKKKKKKERKRNNYSKDNRIATLLYSTISGVSVVSYYHK